MSAARDERPAIVRSIERDVKPRDVRIGDDNVVAILAADRDLIVGSKNRQV